MTNDAKITFQIPDAGSELVFLYFMLSTKMRVHQRFRSSMRKDLYLGGFLLLVGVCYLLGLLYVPLGEFSSVWRIVVTLYLWVGSLSILIGIWMIATTLSSYKSLTRLVDENISTEEMTITIYIETDYDEYGNALESASAELRFLGDDTNQSPAITLSGLNSQPWIKDIVPGTKVKVFCERRYEGPVAIETEKGFLWSKVCRSSSTSNKKISHNSPNLEVQRPRAL